MVIHRTSNHAYVHKLAAFNYYIHRLLRIPRSNKNFVLELNYIKQVAVNNEYLSDMTDKLLLRNQYKRAIHKIYPVAIMQPI